VPKILVADDNTNIQKMVSLAFQERGIDVVSVGNGEAAVRRIADMNPDLVLADIFMPVRNGYEVCEFVKKDSRFSHVPVILLVGAFDPLDEKEARRVGADGVLKKPFVPPDPLIAMVVSALEKNPKVAAEMAKAREVVPEPEPEPMPVALEAPARAEIKALPEFPEPSPEEAAAVYGFGSGKRGNLREGDEGPVPPEAEEQADEDFETTAPSHDWRRSAMDFEVPEETSKSPFALDDESATSMFPSEKDVPPKHVRVKHSLVDTETATQIAPVPLPSASTITPRATLSEQLNGKSALSPTSPLTPAETSHYETQNSLTAATWDAAHAAPIEPEVSTPIAAQPSPNLKSAAPEPSGSVFAETKAVTGASGANETKELVAPAAVADFATSTSFATQGAHWMDAMRAGPADHADTSASATEIQPQPAAVSDELAVSSEPVEVERDDFFAQENEGVASDWLPVVSAGEKKPAVADSDPALEVSGPVPVSHLAADPELIAEPDDAGPISKDPALVEPPPVHVAPDALLVNEDAEGPEYDKHEEETAPAFAFTAAPEADTHATTDVEALTASESEVDRPISTKEPPNREVLAEIPFLTPPSEFLAGNREEPEPTGQDVDAVVQKVLEKLEPQLHQLLSQGLLKPLVENILHNETAKKTR
jgi:CheY-like chemotaxis protein